MKKLISLGLLIVLVLSFAMGCTKSTTYTDGDYTAESEPDDHGYKGAISISVKGGKIETVDYDEYNAEGARKSEDTEYAETMKGVSGVTPAEAYEQLEQSLITKQNPDSVDAVSGATGTSEQFVRLAKEALNKK